MVIATRIFNKEEMEAEEEEQQEEEEVEEEDVDCAMTRGFLMPSGVHRCGRYVDVLLVFHYTYIFGVYEG